MNVEFCIVPNTMIAAIWDYLLPHFQKVVELSCGEINIDIAKRRACTGESITIAVIENDCIVAVCSIEIKVFETGKKVLFIPLLGGTRMEAWLDKGLDVLHMIAKTYGCEEIRGYAVRQGWKKVLASHGWNPIHEIVSVPVKKEV